MIEIEEYIRRDLLDRKLTFSPYVEKMRRKVKKVKFGMEKILSSIFFIESIIQ